MLRILEHNSYSRKLELLASAIAQKLTQGGQEPPRKNNKNFGNISIFFRA